MAACQSVESAAAADSSHIFWSLTMTDKITIGRETLERAIDALDGLLRNISRNAPQLSGKVMGDAEITIDALRAALAAQPAEPVAWLVYAGVCDMWPVYPAYKTRQEALSKAEEIKSVTEVRPLYAAQPAPAAVPLTDDQIDDIIKQHTGGFIGGMHFVHLARAIESAHGIAAAGDKPCTTT
jgi:hypothetical protein